MLREGKMQAHLDNLDMKVENPLLLPDALLLVGKRLLVPLTTSLGAPKNWEHVRVSDALEILLIAHITWPCIRSKTSLNSCVHQAATTPRLVL